MIEPDEKIFMVIISKRLCKKSSTSSVRSRYDRSKFLKSNPITMEMFALLQKNDKKIELLEKEKS